MTAVQTSKRRALRGLNKSLLLRALGLPPNCRWNEARHKLKPMLIEAIRKQDNPTISDLTYAKAVLKATLIRTCGCGSAIKPKSVRCRACSMPKLKITHDRCLCQNWKQKRSARCLVCFRARWKNKKAFETATDWVCPGRDFPLP